MKTFEYTTLFIMFSNLIAAIFISFNIARIGLIALLILGVINIAYIFTSFNTNISTLFFIFAIINATILSLTYMQLFPLLLLGANILAAYYLQTTYQTSYSNKPYTQKQPTPSKNYTTQNPVLTNFETQYDHPEFKPIELFEAELERDKNR